MAFVVIKCGRGGKHAGPPNTKNAPRRRTCVPNRKPGLKEGVHVFTRVPAGEYRDFVIGTVTGVDGDKIGVKGTRVDMVGLKNKVAQGNAEEWSIEILTSPTPDNVIMGLMSMVERHDFAQVLDADECDVIPPTVYAATDGCIQESLPELLNAVLSLPQGEEKDRVRRIARHRMDILLDKNLERTHSEMQSYPIFRRRHDAGLMREK